jgi:hypothetical protein
MSRRTREDIKAERAENAVILTMTGSSYQGSPQAIAAVLRATAV